MENKHSKSAFKNFTEDQVAEAEKDAYMIQIGYELFYDETGSYCAFSKDKTEKYYAGIRAGLEDMIKNGSEEEKKEALISCLNLRIIPLRIQ